MTGRRFTDFVGKFGSNLEEDAGLRKAGIEQEESSKLIGRKRLKSAARLSLDVIVVDAQHREAFDEEGLQQLANSLKTHGQLQPIRVRWDEGREKYVLIAGERRLRAMKLAGITEADCVIASSELSAGEILTQQIIENAQREDLKPIERAKAFRDLMQSQGWDQKRLASELHVSPATVSNSLKLLGLDEETQEQVESGQLTIHEAVTATRKTSKAKGKAAAKALKPKAFRVKAGKVTVEPKAGCSYVDALVMALESAKQDSGLRDAA